MRLPKPNISKDGVKRLTINLSFRVGLNEITHMMMCDTWSFSDQQRENFLQNIKTSSKLLAFVKDCISMNGSSGVSESAEYQTFAQDKLTENEWRKRYQARVQSLINWT